MKYTITYWLAAALTTYLCGAIGGASFDVKEWPPQWNIAVAILMYVATTFAGVYGLAKDRK